MKKTIITLFFITCISFQLSGCTQSSWLYRINVQQGNILTTDMVHQLRRGMSKSAVCDVIGPPILIDTFNDNRWDYVYTFKAGRGRHYVQREVVIYFKNDHVIDIVTHNL